MTQRESANPPAPQAVKTVIVSKAGQSVESSRGSCNESAWPLTLEEQKKTRTKIPSELDSVRENNRPCTSMCSQYSIHVITCISLCQALSDLIQRLMPNIQKKLLCCHGPTLPVAVVPGDMPSHTTGLVSFEN